MGLEGCGSRRVRRQTVHRTMCKGSSVQLAICFGRTLSQHLRISRRIVENSNGPVRLCEPVSLMALGANANVGVGALSLRAQRTRVLARHHKSLAGLSKTMSLA